MLVFVFSFFFLFLFPVNCCHCCGEINLLIILVIIIIIMCFACLLVVGPFPLEDTNILCSNCHRPLYGSLTHIRGSELFCDTCYRHILSEYSLCLLRRNCTPSINSSVVALTLLSLYHNCDSTTIRLRYDDTTTHSTTTEVIEITICVRFDCNMTTIRLRRKMTCSFVARVELEAGARDTS